VHLIDHINQNCHFMKPLLHYAMKNSFKDLKYKISNNSDRIKTTKFSNKQIQLNHHSFHIKDYTLLSPNLATCHNPKSKPISHRSIITYETLTQTRAHNTDTSTLVKI
jgi:hypothetical protein